MGGGGGVTCGRTSAPIGPRPLPLHPCLSNCGLPESPEACDWLAALINPRYCAPLMTNNVFRSSNFFFSFFSSLPAQILQEGKILPRPRAPSFLHIISLLLSSQRPPSPVYLYILSLLPCSTLHTSPPVISLLPGRTSSPCLAIFQSYSLYSVPITTQVGDNNPILPFFFYFFFVFFYFLFTSNFLHLPLHFVYFPHLFIIYYFNFSRLFFCSLL